MNKRWFYQLLFSYLPIFFVVTSALILSFFLAINHMSKNEAIQANEVFNKNIMRTVDYSLRTIEQQAIHEIQTNQYIDEYLNPDSNTNEYLTNFHLAKKLRDFILHNPLVDSVYIYRALDGVIISQDAKIPDNLFSDQEFIEKAQNKKRLYNWSESRLYKGFNSEPDAKTVVSLAKKVPLLSGSKDILVINVSTEAIKSMIKEQTNSDFSFVNIVDKNGNHLYEQDDELLLEAGQYELASFKSDYTEWEFQSGIIDGNVSSVVSILSYAWIIIGILIIILGAAYLIYITKRNYKPIELIMARVKLYSSIKNVELTHGDYRNELQFIDSALQQLIERSIKYREQSKDDINLRQQHFFQELVDGNRKISLKEWQSELDHLNKDTQFEDLSIVIFEIDNFADFLTSYSYEDQFLLKHTLTNIINEIADNYDGITVWPNWLKPDQLCVLFQLTNNSVKGYHKDIDQICEDTREWIQNNLSYTVTVGLGTRVDRLENLPKSYKVAMNSLQYKSTLGNNRLIHTSDIMLKQQDQIHRHIPLISSIVYSFRLEEENWKPKFQIFFDELRNDLLSRDDIISLMNFFIYYLYQEIMKYPDDIQDIWLIETLPRLKEVIGHFETIDDINKQFFEILENMEEKLQNLREQRSHHTLLKEVRDYINLNYNNPDLSLTQISDEFGLRSNNLSKLFKEEFGEKFINYLIKLRVESAKRLLKETDQPIQEIASLVGYHHTMSFIRVFKRVIGITPGIFREKHKI